MTNKKDITDFSDVTSVASQVEHQDRLKTVKTHQKVPVGGAPMPSIPPLDSPPPHRNDPMKVLTDEEIENLKAKGQFIPGAGSAYVTNQPPPVPEGDIPPEKFANPPRPEGGLRPETVKEIEEFGKYAKEMADKDKEEVEDGIVDEFGNIIRNELVNPKRKKSIESRCAPMDISDLLLHQEIRQTVPIVPKKFEPTFRSVSGLEDLFIKRLIGEEGGTDRYVLDKFTLMNLCAAIYAINGKPFPNHLDKDGKPDEKLFEHKFMVLSKYPMPILADLGVNYHWFDKRVRKLLSIENIQDF